MSSWPMVMALSLIGLWPALLLAAVALPAVWSARPARRRAAAGVLAQLLDAARVSDPARRGGGRRGTRRGRAGLGRGRGRRSGRRR